MRRIIGAIAILASIFILGSSLEANAAPTAHWSSRVVYVENHAPGWPLQAGVNGVSQGTGLRLVIVRRCPKNSQCIRVYNTWNMPGSRVGYTVNWSYGNRIVQSQVVLETRYRRYFSGREKASLICHEIGHAVGLDHSSSGCMRHGLSRYSSPTINRWERSLLNRWY